MNNYKVGDIIMTTSNYSWECHSAYFWEVVKTTDKFVTLRKLDTERRYFHNINGSKVYLPEGTPVYYDTPCEEMPIVGKYLMKRHYKNDGSYELVPEEERRKVDDKGYVAITSYECGKLWNGKPEEVWNLH